ncbi:MbtH family protein [Streptomyces dangxiongensis]|uniref:MbtH family protein n=1 Tax=Streptomyces dangxiongensis TaxID=1442032 RepID=A0A3G2JL90_9ACTN|nr:MbtH family protein [Streptomyces dangxiongensis]AYN43226.1 MbtH family protein [Streptomyces dangxiongensis]
MDNPFEQPDARYLVLVNDAAQYSLWPSRAAVPAGWSVALAAASRQACLDHVEAHRPDPRPRSVDGAAHTG